MKKLLLFTLMAIAVGGCKEKPCPDIMRYENEKGVFTIDLETGDTIMRVLKMPESSTPIKDTMPYLPDWVEQDIVTVDACQIKLIPAIKIVQVGRKYTAVLNNNGYLSPRFGKMDWSTGEPTFFTDTCRLKESIRWFISIHVVAYKSQL